jgi:hypothetical protein
VSQGTKAELMTERNELRIRTNKLSAALIADSDPYVQEYKTVLERQLEAMYTYQAILESRLAT